MKRTILAVLLLAVAAFAQNPPTNAPQFTFTENFFSGSPYGQNQALGTAVTTQLTANSQLRVDQLTIPSVGYTGELLGPQYNLCGIKAVENLVMSTTINCTNLSIYANGEVGYGRLQQNGGPASHGVAFKLAMAFNYALSTHVAVNVAEFGYTDLGAPPTPGFSRAGWFGQSGISLLLGNSATASAAKQARWQRAQAKKQAKLKKAMEKKGLLPKEGEAYGS